ncbi:2125_t:CDS:2 [Rhizophagus irregularis]|nr:2125_t:CDS:2 [Rhizophagus irregularis]
MSLKRTILTEIQKREICTYARDNKRTCTQVNESTIIRILQTAEKRFNSKTISSNTKRHKPVTYPELELALKEFVLDY